MASKKRMKNKTGSEYGAKSKGKMGGANSCLYRPLSYRNLDCYTNAKFMFVWF